MEAEHTFYIVVSNCLLFIWAAANSPSKKKYCS